MADQTEPKRANGPRIAAPRDEAAPAEFQGMPIDDNLAFADFSNAYDEVQQARKTLEVFGTARLASPPAPEVIAAQRAFDEATKKYNKIVATLIKPKF